MTVQTDWQMAATDSDPDDVCAVDGCTRPKGHRGWHTQPKVKPAAQPKVKPAAQPKVRITLTVALADLLEIATIEGISL